MRHALCLAIGGCLAASALAQPSIVDVGLYAGLPSTELHAVNLGGNIAAGECYSGGYAQYPRSGQQAVRWTAEGLESVAAPDLGAANAMNEAGQIIVGDSAPGNSFHAFRWSAFDGFHPLAMLADWTQSSAKAVSADGSITVGFGWGPSTVQSPCRWTVAQGLQLLPLAGAADGYAAAISADGSIIAGRAGTNAVRWINGANPAPLGAGNAYGISSDGRVTVGASSFNGLSRAARWVDNAGAVTVTNLGAVPVISGWPEDQVYSTALAVSGDGKTIVGYTGVIPNLHTPRAFLWREELGIVDLTNYLSSIGLDMSGRELITANAINYSGTVIAAGRSIVHLPPWCGGADFNHDGDARTDADIEAFFACLAGHCCATCDSADFNGDGDSGTDADIESFFRVLAGGPC
jgi:uncharacterized membrane protein